MTREGLEDRSWVQEPADYISELVSSDSVNVYEVLNNAGHSSSNNYGDKIKINIYNDTEEIFPSQEIMLNKSYSFLI